MRGTTQLIAEQISRHCEHWRRFGWIIDYDVTFDSYVGQFDMRLQFIGDRWKRYTLSDHEIRMGGAQDAERWMYRVESDVRHTLRSLTRSATAIYGRRHVRPEMVVDIPQIRPGAVMWVDEWRHIAESIYPRQDTKAEKKAKKLFISVAGLPAYKKLKSGEPLPIVGSKGSNYLLHKKASYCIERPSDGAKLCAVVPGVPLWDHLLGIKLMVEHDEPTFLKTANVSGGTPADVSIFHQAMQRIAANLYD